MTIGATSTFSESCDEICSDALSKLGVVAPGVDASGSRTSKQNLHARRALNRLVKSLDSDGQFLWRIERRSINLADFDIQLGTSTYLGLDVLDLDEPLRLDQNDGSQPTPLYSMSRDEYMTADRTTVGTPNRYFFEKRLGGLGPKLFVTPSYDTSSLATLEYPAFIRAADYTSGADTSDFMQKWERCLVWGLAAELAPDYGQTSKLDAFNTMFLAEKTKLLADDNEKGNLRLVPFGFGGCY